MSITAFHLFLTSTANFARPADREGFPPISNA